MGWFALHPVFAHGAPHPRLDKVIVRVWLPYVATALRDDVLTVALAHNRLSHIARHDNDRVNDTTRRMGNTVDLAMKFRRGKAMDGRIYGVLRDLGNVGRARRSDKLM